MAARLYDPLMPMSVTGVIVQKMLRGLHKHGQKLVYRPGCLVAIVQSHRPRLDRAIRFLGGAGLVT